MSKDSQVTSFEWKGRAGPFQLSVTPGVFVPSTTTRLLADALQVSPGDSLLDLGCGTGVLSIVASLLGARWVTGCDASDEAIRVSRMNARTHGISERVEFRQGDLFSALDDDFLADVVIGDVSGVPDALALATGWFPDGKGGGPTGAELPTRMLRRVGRYLSAAGRLLLPTGTIQREDLVLDAARDAFEKVELVATRDVPFPSRIVDSSATIRRLLDEGTVRLMQRGSRHMWTISAWLCGRPRRKPSLNGGLD